MEKIQTEDFFNNVKERKEKMTNEELKVIYNNALILLDKYKITGQIEAMKKILFILGCVDKEHQLIEQGINTYINRQDIDKYIDIIASNDVAIVELERYEREIPDDIVKLVADTKKIFSRYYVLFTDYKHQHKKTMEKKTIVKDPILFGVFENDENISDRFYFLGDWVDDYCDLTLDKMVQKCKKNNVDILHEIYTPKKLEDLKAEVNNLVFRDGKYIHNPVKQKSEGFIKKIKNLFK